MRSILNAIRLLFVMIILTGIIYPLCVTAVSAIFFSDKSKGSIKYKDDKAVGSRWIGQNFTQDKYFWSRPSAGNYQTMASSASNITPAGPQIKLNMQKYHNKYANSSGKVADEMLFTSASGLDPHISPQAAFEQAQRIAKIRNKNIEVIQSLIRANIENRSFGFLGQERINVLELNLALDNMD